MSLHSPRTWVIGGALLALVLAVLGWYAVVQPQRADAAAVRSEVVAAESAEDLQRARLAQLREDLVELPEHQTELVAVRESVPMTVDLPALTRDLTAAANDAGVTLMNVAPSLPAASGATSDGPATDATDTGTTASGGTTTPDATTAGTAAPQTVALQLAVIGPFSGAREFLRSVQDLGHPSVLVTGLKVTGQEPADASDGRPATVNGDVELVVSAAIFVLPSTAS